MGHLSHTFAPNSVIKFSKIWQMMDDAAWKELSKDFPWTEQLLEKYMNYVDWKEILYLCRRDLQGGHF